VVVIEGVLLYLEEEVIRRLLQLLGRLFPQHKLICDLMSRKFFEQYGRTFQEKVTGLGTSFKFTVDNPEEIFLENGNRRTGKASIVEKAVEFGLKKIPQVALKTLLRTLASGNAVYMFEAY
jgi:O-methyltransferase involved in polyketide biosynthesis